MISRPGWWLVSLWLYIAPITTITNKLKFIMGLLYVCLPLNLLTYGLNDYADVDLDILNDRKGNFIFGPKGLTREKLRLVLKIAFCATLLPLPLFCFSAKHFVLQQFMVYLVWCALGLLVNISYNFDILGKLSNHGPWETPLVYIGFGLVTAFSYWLNVAFQQQQQEEEIGTLVWRDYVLGTTNSNDATLSFRLFGCNKYYWIHLWFLTLQTQAWTEYMDYNVDLKCHRQTTLVRLSNNKRSNACLFVKFILWTNVAWTYSIYRINHEWNKVLAYAIMSAVMFVVTEHIQQRGDKNSPSLGSLWWFVAIGQNAGGLLLLHDVWTKGLFVR